MLAFNPMDLLGGAAIPPSTPTSVKTPQDDFLQKFGLSPEQMGFAQMEPERMQALNDQIQQALALRNAPMAHHTTGVGSGLESLGHIFNVVNGGMRERKYRDQQEAMRQKLEPLLGKVSQGNLESANRAMSADDAYRQAMLQALTRGGAGGSF